MPSPTLLSEFSRLGRRDCCIHLIVQLPENSQYRSVTQLADHLSDGRGFFDQKQIYSICKTVRDRERPRTLLPGPNQRPPTEVQPEPRQLIIQTGTRYGKICF